MTHGLLLVLDLTGTFVFAIRYNWNLPVEKQIGNGEEDGES